MTIFGMTQEEIRKLTKRENAEYKWITTSILGEKTNRDIEVRKIGGRPVRYADLLDYTIKKLEDFNREIEERGLTLYEFDKSVMDSELKKINDINISMQDSLGSLDHNLNESISTDFIGTEEELKDYIKEIQELSNQQLNDLRKNKVEKPISIPNEYGPEMALLASRLLDENEKDICKRLGIEEANYLANKIDLVFRGEIKIRNNHSPMAD